MKFIWFCAFTLYSLLVAGQQVGSKVSFVATDKKTYTGTIKEVQGGYYKVKYDGHDFEAWLTSEQFTVNASITPVGASTTTNTMPDLAAVFEFGKSRGWATKVQEQYFANYVGRMNANDQARLLQFLQGATSASARFFVLKSLLAGDDYTVLQRFITELNNYPEDVQQEKCLLTNRRSIIQQWEFSCSVTTVQTYMGDLSPAMLGM